MNSKIVETLAMMCDKNNPQDKKLLLLAELVETKCEELAENQLELKGSLDETNKKLDRLTTILEKYEKDESDCPVFQHRQNFQHLAMMFKHPKVALLIIIGILALLLGVFNSSFISLFKLLLGA